MSAEILQTVKESPPSKALPITLLNIFDILDKEKTSEDTLHFITQTINLLNQDTVVGEQAKERLDKNLTQYPMNIRDYRRNWDNFVRQIYDKPEYSVVKATIAFDGSLQRLDRSGLSYFDFERNIYCIDHHPAKGRLTMKATSGQLLDILLNPESVEGGVDLVYELCMAAVFDDYKIMQLYCETDGDNVIPRILCNRFYKVLSCPKNQKQILIDLINHHNEMDVKCGLDSDLAIRLDKDPDTQMLDALLRFVCQSDTCARAKKGILSQPHTENEELDIYRTIMDDSLRHFDELLNILSELDEPKLDVLYRHIVAQIPDIDTSFTIIEKEYQPVEISVIKNGKEFKLALFEDTIDGRRRIALQYAGGIFRKPGDISMSINLTGQLVEQGYDTSIFYDLMRKEFKDIQIGGADITGGGQSAFELNIYKVWEVFLESLRQQDWVIDS